MLWIIASCTFKNADFLSSEVLIDVQESVLKIHHINCVTWLPNQSRYEQLRYAGNKIFYKSIYHPDNRFHWLFVRINFNWIN